MRVTVVDYAGMRLAIDLEQAAAYGLLMPRDFRLPHDGEDFEE